ncbi:MAG: TIGR02221 family CRISPR-associated protein [Deltaproteobacteria bacterium]|nr:MAG: TIGR02221 family CRISPR-associated protein [Deltaproteobacteria bacterium]
MARLFLSTLGTTEYSEVYYKLDDNPPYLTPFVQEALVNFLCRKWSANDRIVMFCTEKARQINWINEDPGDVGEGSGKGLEDRLKALGLNAEIGMVTIPEGKSESEIMEIFSRVTEEIREQDSVVLDITHSYRSLPLLNIVVLNYAKALKRIKVERICYGAYEARENNVAPIFDLTPYDRLLDWSVAVNEFIGYGIPDRVTALVREDVSPILMEKRGKDITAASIKKLADRLCKMSQNIRSARCFEIEKFVSLKGDVDKIKEQKLIPPLNPLLDKIVEKTEGFGAESATLKGFEAVKWCIEHDLLPQAYIILLETVLTGVCRKLGYDPAKKKERNFLSALLSVVGQKKPESKWEGELKRKMEKAREILVKYDVPFKELAKAYSKLGNHRNDFMHCGCSGSPGKHETLRTKIHQLYDDVTLAWSKFDSALT